MSTCLHPICEKNHPLSLILRKHFAKEYTWILYSNTSMCLSDRLGPLTRANTKRRDKQLSNVSASNENLGFNRAKPVRTLCH